MFFESNRWIQWLSGTDGSFPCFPNTFYSLFYMEFCLANKSSKVTCQSVKNSRSLNSSRLDRLATTSTGHA